MNIDFFHRMYNPTVLLCLDDVVLDGNLLNVDQIYDLFFLLQPSILSLSILLTVHFRMIQILIDM
jgi:hypothetical protein